MMQVISLDKGPVAATDYLTANARGIAKASLQLRTARVHGLPPRVDAIICASDLQGRECGDRPGRLLGVVAAEWVAALQREGRLPPPDRCGVVLAGDLYADPTLAYRDVPGDVRPVWEAFAAIARWVVGVPGDHDRFGDEDAERFSRRVGVQVLDGGVAEVNGLRIGGLGGVIGREGDEGSRTELDFVVATAGLVSQRPDMLVLHESPAAPERGCPGNVELRTTINRIHRRRVIDPLPVVLAGHSPWPFPWVRTTTGFDAINVHSRLVVLRW